MADISLYDLVTPDQEQDAFVNTVDMMLKISYQIEDIVIDNALPVDFYAGFQRFSHFRHQDARYRRLADVARRVYVFGEADVTPPNIPGVQFVPLAPGSALTREWFLVINTPGFFTALLTQEIPGVDPIRGDRRFQGLWTYDESVVNNAHLLISQQLRQPYRPVAARDYRAQNRYLVRMSSKMVQYSEAINLSRAQTAGGLTMLSQMAQEMGGADLDRSLYAVAQAVRQSFQARAVRLYLSNGDGALHLKAASAQGLVPTHHTLYVDQGAPGEALISRRTVLVPDLAESSEPDPLDPEVRSLVAVPLLAGDQPLGVLVVGRDFANGFDDMAIMLLNTVAAQLGLALERDQLLQAQDSAQRMLASVMGGATEAIIAADAGGRLLHLNPAAEAALGVTAAQVVGRPFTALGHSALNELCQELLAHGNDLYREITLPGGAAVLAGASLVRDSRNAPAGWVLVLQSLDAARAAVASAPAPGDVEGAASAMTLIESSFAVDQDLDNRLRTISGLTALLPSRVALDEDQNRYVYQIIKLTRETARMVNNLVYLNTLEARDSFETAPVALDRLLAETMEKFRATATRKGVTLTLDPVPDLQPAINGPAVQRAVQNLIENAIKYTPAGGTVRLAVEATAAEVRLLVRDTGIGLWPRDLALVFNRFYRVINQPNNDTPSAGLGLAVVKAVAERHGGRAWAESSLGEGSVFGLGLPR
jgi:signal transduction histidine kinase/DICT domain-containing protein